MTTKQYTKSVRRKVLLTMHQSCPNDKKVDTVPFFTDGQPQVVLWLWMWQGRWCSSHQYWVRIPGWRVNAGYWQSIVLRKSRASPGRLYTTSPAPAGTPGQLEVGTSVQNAAILGKLCCENTMLLPNCSYKLPVFALMSLFIYFFLNVKS